jgi:membrane-associated phospholipid phosphatase
MALLSRALLAVLIAAGVAEPASAKSSSIETSGTAVAIALPLTAAGISLWKEDGHGLAQLGAVTILTVGTAFLLKQVVHEERPDHSDNQSFPSDTAALAFAPAQFLWTRYGWQYGVPAYLAAGFVGYSRVESDQHHWWDVAASAGISWGYNRLITSHYFPPNLYGSASVSSKGANLSLTYNW